MDKHLLCPRTEICFVYGLYVKATGDENAGVIEIESIENRDFYSCRALMSVMKLHREGKLAPEVSQRLEGLMDCYLTFQANRAVEKHRQDY